MKRAINTFIWLLLLFVCTFPPIDLYPEIYIQPKWTATVWVVLLCCTFGKRPNENYLSWAACLIAVYLCIYSPFENNSVRALHLCLLLPFVHQAHLSKRRVQRSAVWVVEGMVIITLILIQCRTAYLCLMLFLLLYCLPYRRLYQRVFVIIFFVVVLLFLSIFGMKTESSRGRWFILGNTIELVKEHPLTGYGKHGFRKIYMKKQAEYFKSHPDSTYSMLADEVRHPLNEFLYVAVNWGIIASILLFIVVVTPLFCYSKVSNSPWRYALMAVFVFSMFCYPLCYPLAWCVIVGNWVRLFSNIPLSSVSRVVFCILFLVPFAYNDYYLRRWGCISHLSKSGHPKAMMKYYKELYPRLHHSPDFLYDYAIESFYAMKFMQAYNLAEECGKEMSSYDLSLLRGDICFQRHRYEEALMHYQEAEWMCPVRFAPLSGMWEVYIRQGNSLSADSIRNIILNKPVKVLSPEILRIKQMVKVNGNELERSI
ncbi:MAG: O-antigen ligase family protein [Bacteroidaceae bacterium]|nr:O-antigen ligase family protein [Bacteroidaceae bacterium]